MYLYIPAPTAPRSLTLVMGGQDVVELDWLPPVAPNGDVMYTVQQDIGGSPTTGIMDTNFTVTGQPPGMNVTFTVVAVTTANTSQESNPVTFCNDTGEYCTVLYILLVFLCTWTGCHLTIVLDI